jgi:hypothetical protein
VVPQLWDSYLGLKSARFIKGNGIQNCWAFLGFVYRPEFEILENATFRKLDLFPSSGDGKETPTLLGPLES